MKDKEISARFLAIDRFMNKLLIFLLGAATAIVTTFVLSIVFYGG